MTRALAKKLKRDRRSAAIISLPFLALMVLSLVLVCGAMQLILTFFFLSMFSFFFGMFLGIDGALECEKDANIV